MRDPGPLAPALEAIGHKVEDVPRRPLLHGTGQALATIGLPDADGTVTWVGILVSGESVRFFGPPAPSVGPSRGHRMQAPTAELVDRLSDAVRIYLERIEELDEKLSETQHPGPPVPPPPAPAPHPRTPPLPAH